MYINVYILVTFKCTLYRFEKYFLLLQRLLENCVLKKCRLNKLGPSIKKQKHHKERYFWGKVNGLYLARYIGYIGQGIEDILDKV